MQRHQKQQAEQSPVQYNYASYSRTNSSFFYRNNEYTARSQIGEGMFGKVTAFVNVASEDPDDCFAVKKPNSLFDDRYDEMNRSVLIREAEFWNMVYPHNAAILVHQKKKFHFFKPSIKEKCRLVMPCIKGKTLNDVLNDEIKTDPARQLAIILAAAQALHHDVHQHHVIHGDIKGDNIMLNTASGQDIITFIDFGLAYKAKRFRKDFLPMKLAAAVNYIAPERYAKAPLLCGHPSQDIFSFGYMILRRCPYLLDLEIGAVLSKTQSQNPNDRPNMPELIVALEVALMQQSKLAANINHVQPALTR